MNVDRNQKGFVWMSHGSFVGIGSVNKTLLDEFHLRKNGFGFI